jgi:hypothetical protein
MSLMTAWTFNAHGSLRPRRPYPIDTKLSGNPSTSIACTIIPINDNLKLNAINTVRPYLTSHDPDMLLATDIEFEEKQFFDNKELGTQCNNPTDESEWTEVIHSKKNKKKTPHSSPTLSPHNVPKHCTRHSDHRNA